MKKMLQKLCLLSLLATPLFGQPVLTKFENGKAYLAPGCIYISAENIYINIDEVLIPLSDLHADDEGIYVTEEEVIDGLRDALPYWEPPNGY